MEEKREITNEKNSKLAVFSLEDLAARIARSLGSVPSLLFHSAFFVGIFGLSFFGFSFDQIMLILTTVVSLEAIYLAIFIQMTVNRHSEHIEEVREDIEDIQEDVEDISEDIEDIQENVEDIGEDVEGIHKEVEEIGDDVEEISEDTEEKEDRPEKSPTDEKLERIEATLQTLAREIENLRKGRE